MSGRVINQTTGLTGREERKNEAIGRLDGRKRQKCVSLVLFLKRFRWLK